MSKNQKELSFIPNKWGIPIYDEIGESIRETLRVLQENECNEISTDAVGEYYHNEHSDEHQEDDEGESSPSRERNSFTKSDKQIPRQLQR